MELESSPIHLKSSLIELESSLIKLEGSVIELESSLIQLERCLSLYIVVAEIILYQIDSSNAIKLQARASCAKVYNVQNHSLNKIQNY